MIESEIKIEGFNSLMDMQKRMVEIVIRNQDKPLTDNLLFYGSRDELRDALRFHSFEHISTYLLENYYEYYLLYVDRGEIG